jgi:subtilisin family serine protease
VVDRALETAAREVSVPGPWGWYGSLAIRQSSLDSSPRALASPGRGSTVRDARDPLDVVRLTPLMQRTDGAPGVAVALVDGPVAIAHPDLAGERIHEIPGVLRGTCARAASAACRHGTFVAGMLTARRDSVAPAICPGCTLLLRPIFGETTDAGRMPSASPEELAAAVTDAVTAGARVINISAALQSPKRTGERAIEHALTHAALHDVIVVAAAGNQRTVGGSALARHTCVIPVVACDRRGLPVDRSTLGSSIGRRGLSAPGVGVTSLGSESDPVTLGGTSAAAPFVTGTIALLWSEFPAASAVEVRLAVSNAGRRRRSTVVPPLLDAWAAYGELAGR